MRFIDVVLRLGVWRLAWYGGYGRNSHSRRGQRMCYCYRSCFAGDPIASREKVSQRPRTWFGDRTERSPRAIEIAYPRA